MDKRALWIPAGLFLFLAHCKGPPSSSVGGDAGGANPERQQMHAGPSDGGLGDDFQGIVQVNATSPDADPTVARVEVREGRARWDFGAGGDYRVLDLAAGRLFSVTRATSTTFAGSIKGDAKAAAAPRVTLSPLSPATGQVDGVPCERMGVTEHGMRYELCLARGALHLPLEVVTPAVTTAVPFVAQLEGEGMLPLAVVVRDAAPDAGRLAPVAATLHVAFFHDQVDANRVELPSANRLVETSGVTVAAPALR